MKDQRLALEPRGVRREQNERESVEEAHSALMTRRSAALAATTLMHAKIVCVVTLKETWNEGREMKDEGEAKGGCERKGSGFGREERRAISLHDDVSAAPADSSN